MECCVPPVSGNGGFMAAKQGLPRILFPRSINQALEYHDSEPDAVFWAGGTGFAIDDPRSSSPVVLPKVVIALSLVEELARASRSENSIEVGAMMSLDRLASIGRKNLPPGLAEVLSNIGTWPLRCRATLGGNLASEGDLLPLLQMLDAKIEIRYLRERKGRRKPVPTASRVPLMILDEEKGLRRGDLITRISIPTDIWNFAVVKKIGSSGFRDADLSFLAVAKVDKSTLVDWRMCFRDAKGRVYRDRDIEAVLAGSPLPLARRSSEHLDEAVKQSLMNWQGDSHNRERALCLVRAFMRQAAG